MTNATVGFRRLIAPLAATAVLIPALLINSAAQSLAAEDIVLWTAAASPADVRGNWVREADATAAAGVVLRNPDLGQNRIATALASPTNYFEVRFTAKRSTAYHMWIRLRAQGDDTQNDSVHVQFSDSVDANGQAITRIGSADSAVEDTLFRTRRSSSGTR